MTDQTDDNHYGLPEGFTCTLTALTVGWKASYGGKDAFGDTPEIAMRILYSWLR